MPTRRHIRQRLLYFGGSFNPIHRGHLQCALAVANALSFNRIILVPSAMPPHKPGHTDLAPASHRVEMCRLAALENPLLAVDDREVDRAGLSYTIDTVRELRDEGIDPVYWLIGADMLRLLPEWHEPEALIKEVHFLILARPGWSFDWQAMPQAYRHLQDHVVSAPLLDISATDIRQRVKAGQSVGHLVPESVEMYILAQGLYREG